MEYTISIQKDAKSGWYCGQCVQLPAAISQGETLNELMENMKDAILLVLDGCSTSSRNKRYYRKANL